MITIVPIKLKRFLLDKIIYPFISLPFVFNLCIFISPSSIEFFKRRGWSLTHPFDKEYGVNTSGFLGVDKISKTLKDINPYAAASPTMLRNVLNQLINLDNYSFIDIGCGKGRCLIIASEYPFKSITGIDLSDELIFTCKKNSLKIKNNFPSRTSIEAVCVNALEYNFTEKKLVIYFYHSFGKELFKELVSNLEKSLINNIDHLFFIYLNPVNGFILDNSESFTRFMAAKYKLPKKEIGFGPDVEDSVVVWQSVKNKIAPLPSSNMVIYSPHPMRAEVK